MIKKEKRQKEESGEFMNKVIFEKRMKNGYYVITGVKLSPEIQEAQEKGGLFPLLRIPSSIEGIPVEEVESLTTQGGAFAVRELYFEDGITKIKEGSCEKVYTKKVRLPNTLVEIEDAIGEWELEEIVIPASVKLIGEAPFGFVQTVLNLSDTTIHSAFYRNWSTGVDRRKVQIINLGEGRVLWDLETPFLHGYGVNDLHKMRKADIAYRLTIYSRKKDNNIFHTSVNGLEYANQNVLNEPIRDLNQIIFKTLQNNDYLNSYSYNVESNQLFIEIDDGFIQTKEELLINEMISLEVLSKKEKPEEVGLLRSLFKKIF